MIVTKDGKCRGAVTTDRKGWADAEASASGSGKLRVLAVDCAVDTVSDKSVIRCKATYICVYALQIEHAASRIDSSVEPLVRRKFA